MRFSLVPTNAGSDTYAVYDDVENRFVPGFIGVSYEVAIEVRDILNQRVDRPDLTRADGKLVSA